VRRITLVSWPIERIWEVSEPRSGGVGIREVLKVLRTLGVSRTAVHETKRT
jgi:hypothetical protein